MGKSFLTILWLIAGLLGVVDGTRAQKATLAAGGQQIEFEERRILAYSPDGMLLAVWDREADRLCVVEVETRRERACGDLSQLDSGLREEDVAWSPDSSKIAFGEESFRNLVDGDLWVMDAETSEMTNVAADGFRGRLPIGNKDKTPFSFDVLPAWRPDDGALAFSRSPNINGEYRGNQIVTVSPDGGSVTTLVSVTLDEPGVVHHGMRWSGDGGYLLFTVAHSSSDNAQNGLWIVNRDGSNPRQVIGSDPELGPPVVVDVTSAGDKALVIYLEAAMRLSVRGPYYAIVDTSSGEREMVEVDLSDQPERAFVSLATFSPDGTKLLTVTNLTEPDGIVQVRDFESGVVAQIGEPIPDAGMGVTGDGPEWATNGTVYVPRGISAGTIISVDPGVDVVPPEPPAPPAAVGGALAPGATVVTNDVNVAMQSAPSTHALVVLELEQGAALTVVSPEVEGDGFVWVLVIEPETQTVGYVREEFLSPT